MDPVTLVLAAGLLLMLATFAFVLRPSLRAVDVEADALVVGGSRLPWERIDRLVYSRGMDGALFRVYVGSEAITFRDVQLDVHPDSVRTEIVRRAGLVVDAAAERPRGLRALPGDLFEGWAARALVEARDARDAARSGAAPEPGGRGAWDARDAQAPGRALPVPRPYARGRGSTVGLAALAFVVLKLGKWLLVGLGFVGKALKLGKFGPTALSMLVSVWAYAMLWGWRFGLGFVLLIFLHELGHAAVMARKGLRTSPIVFIPLLGAFIGIKDQMRDAATEAEMAYGGPVAGALAATACYLVFERTGNPFWLHLAYVGFLLNLFNLIPVSPLDGGRVVTAISPWLWVPGLLLAGGLAFVTANPLVILVVLLGVLRAVGEWRRARAGASMGYFELAPGHRAVMTVAYFGLCAYLGFMLHHTFELAGAPV